MTTEGQRSRMKRDLSKRLERGTHLTREEFRLLPGGEVATLVNLVEVGDVGVRLLHPATWCAEDLAGEGGVPDRQRDLRRGLSGRLCGGLPAVPILPSCRGTSASQPVEGDVVEDLITGEIARRLTVDEGT